MQFPVSERGLQRQELAGQPEGLRASPRLSVLASTLCRPLSPPPPVIPMRKNSGLHFLPPRGIVGTVYMGTQKLPRPPGPPVSLSTVFPGWALLPWAAKAAGRHGVTMCVGSGSRLPVGRWLPLAEWGQRSLLAGELHVQM